MDENEKTWQDELVEKYPKLLEHTYPCVGEGWKDLLDNMLGQIQHYMEWRWEKNENNVVLQDGEEPPETGEWIARPFFAQIKEKFGTLRAYYYGGDDRIRGIVDTTEGMSRHICEQCGDKGTPTEGGWIQVLCEKHHEEHRLRQEKREQERQALKDTRNAEVHSESR